MAELRSRVGWRLRPTVISPRPAPFLLDHPTSGRCECRVATLAYPPLEFSICGGFQLLASIALQNMSFAATSADMNV